MLKHELYTRTVAGELQFFVEFTGTLEEHEITGIDFLSPESDTWIPIAVPHFITDHKDEYALVETAITNYFTKEKQ